MCKSIKYENWLEKLCEGIKKAKLSKKYVEKWKKKLKEIRNW